LFRIAELILRASDGIDVTTALAVISETGADMSRFPTAGHFGVGWDCVRVPRLPGQSDERENQAVANRAAQALRLAAAALRSSHQHSRVFPQNVRAHGQAKAVTAARTNWRA